MDCLTLTPWSCAASAIESAPTGGNQKASAGTTQADIQYRFGRTEVLSTQASRATKSTAQTSPLILGKGGCHYYAHRPSVQWDDLFWSSAARVRTGTRDCCKAR